MITLMVLPGVGAKIAVIDTSPDGITNELDVEDCAGALHPLVAELLTVIEEYPLRQPLFQNHFTKTVLNRRLVTAPVKLAVDDVSRCVVNEPDKVNLPRLAINLEIPTVFQQPACDMPLRSKDIDI